MKRTLLALLAPPAAVARYGCAACTAAPIGVFWLSSLAGIGYGLAGGTLGGLLGSGGLAVSYTHLDVYKRQVHLMVNHVQYDLQHGGDNAAAAGTTRD